VFIQRLRTATRRRRRPPRQQRPLPNIERHSPLSYAPRYCVYRVLFAVCDIQRSDDGRRAMSAMRSSSRCAPNVLPPSAGLARTHPALVASPLLFCCRIDLGRCHGHRRHRLFVARRRAVRTSLFSFLAKRRSSELIRCHSDRRIRCVRRAVAGSNRTAPALLCSAVISLIMLLLSLLFKTCTVGQRCCGNAKHGCVR
jgi:hypothetical protein